MIQSSESPSKSSGNNPSTQSRAIVAAAVATAAASFTYAYHLHAPGRSTDFGQVWFSARALLDGLNPYLLVGPGQIFEWDWILFYPATTFVAAIPLSWMPQLVASLFFVWISSWLLTYELTRSGWHKLYLVASAPFVVAAGAAQWSPLFSAMLLRPSLGLLAAAKPNLGAAITLGSDSTRLVVYSMAGALILLAVSLALMPEWISYWLANVSRASHLVSPITRPGGVLVLAALLRWRRFDARLVLLLACVPQTGAWYEALPLLILPETKTECRVVSMLSSLGYAATLFIPTHSERQFNQDTATLMVWFCYLPATWLVLSRQNRGEIPAFLRLIRRPIRSVSTSRRVDSRGES